MSRDVRNDVTPRPCIVLNFAVVRHYLASMKTSFGFSRKLKLKQGKQSYCVVLMLSFVFHAHLKFLE